MLLGWERKQFIGGNSMLILNAVIILGTYAGLRIKSFYKNKHQTVVEDPTLVQDSEVEKQQHYVNLGVGSIGLSLLGLVYAPFKLVSFVAIAYTTLPILRRAEASLSQKHELKNDTLSAVVSVISLASGVQLAAAIQAYVYHLGFQMVNRSKDLSEQVLSHVFTEQSIQVWVLRAGIEMQIELTDLQINEVVAIKTGEVIPIDGVVVHGSATVDQQTLTGESIPVEKGLADEVFAATLIISGELQIQVEKTGKETSVAQLAKILHNTTDFKTKLQLRGEHISDACTLPLMTTSLVLMPMLGLQTAITLLFSAPTNTIKVMTSTQTYNYMTLIASHRILIKDGRALEALGSIDVVLFDKTGTLTEEQPKIAIITPFTDLTRDQILIYAAAAEVRLSHPIAKAIVAAAKERGLDIPQIDKAYYKMGHGISVQLDDKLIQVGSARFMQKEDISVPETANMSAIFVAINAEIQGSLELEATIRAEVPQIIGLLRQQGIKKIMVVSGDHQQPTQKLAEDLGIDEYFYEALPQDKANIVQQLQQQGHKVCFVGDGINDVLAMQSADLAISLAGASSVATDTAQVVFMDGNLMHLNQLFKIAAELETSLSKTLCAWGLFGVSNFSLALISPIGLVRSSLLFGSLFIVGLGYVTLPLIQIIQKETQHTKKLTKQD